MLRVLIVVIGVLVLGWPVEAQRGRRPGRLRPPISSGYPDATNTGYVHTGVTLTTYSSPCTITTPGTIIDSKDITCCLSVEAANVTIKRSRSVVDCGLQNIWSNSTGLLIEDVEIDAVYDGDCVNGGVAVSGLGGFTLRRVNAYSGGTAVIWIEGTATVEDSYIHDPIPTSVCSAMHTDGIQLPDGAASVTIRHNRIYGKYEGGADFGNAAITACGPGDACTDILIEDNILAGGGYTMQCGGNPPAPTNFRVNNNRFSTVFTSSVGGFGPHAGTEGTIGCSPGGGNATEFSGNVCHEGGTLSTSGCTAPEPLGGAWFPTIRRSTARFSSGA
jgi:hypothetical protein